MPTVIVPGVPPRTPVPSVVGEVVSGDGHVVGGIAGPLGRPTFTGVVVVSVGGVPSAQGFGAVAYDQTIQIAGVPPSSTIGRANVYVLWLHPSDCLTDIDLEPAGRRDLYLQPMEVG